MPLQLDMRRKIFQHADYKKGEVPFLTEEWPQANLYSEYEYIWGSKDQTVVKPSEVTEQPEGDVAPPLTSSPLTSSPLVTAPRPHGELAAPAVEAICFDKELGEKDSGLEEAGADVDDDGGLE